MAKELEKLRVEIDALDKKIQSLMSNASISTLSFSNSLAILSLTNSLPLRYLQLVLNY
jgi:hypothetical protein